MKQDLAVVGPRLVLTIQFAGEPCLNLTPLSTVDNGMLVLIKRELGG